MGIGIGSIRAPRVAAVAQTEQESLEDYVTKFIKGTFLELVHRFPKPEELGLFGWIACEWWIRVPHADKYTHLGGRKFLRDLMLWGPESGAYTDWPDVENVHWEHLWMIANRMITQLIMGYVNDPSAPPFDHSARVYVATVLRDLIAKRRQEVRDCDEEEKEKALLDCKAEFGKALRAEVSRQLGCDPFNPLSADRLLVWTEFSDDHEPGFSYASTYKLGTITDPWSRHPVEVCRGYHGTDSENPDWICNQLALLMEAHIDFFTKNYYCGPHEWGFLESGAASRPEYLDHFPDQLKALCKIRDVWLDLWRMGHYPPPFAKGLDFAALDVPYLRISSPDFDLLEPRYVVYASLRAFYEVVPACMLAVLRDRSKPADDRDRLVVNIWFGPYLWDCNIPCKTDAEGNCLPWFAEDLDRRFAADFFGLKPWMSVTEDWVYQEPGIFEKWKAEKYLYDQPLFDQDYYVWVPWTNEDPKAKIDQKMRHPQKVYSIAPGYNDTMDFRLTPSVKRHEYGKGFIREWLRATWYAFHEDEDEDKQISQIYLQCWDGTHEGLCITDTLEHRRFYVNAIKHLKRFTKKYYRSGVPPWTGRGENGYQIFAKAAMITAYRAVFGRDQVDPRHQQDFDDLLQHLLTQEDNYLEAVPRVFDAICEHIDNLRRWPPVIDLAVEDINNEISEDGEHPSFTLKMSYRNYGAPKWLSCRFMIYLPLRTRYSDKPFNEDQVNRVCAYAKPIACSDADPSLLLLGLCPNRLEFPWLFEHTGDTFNHAPREFMFKVRGHEILEFVRRGIALAGKGVSADWWGGLEAGLWPRQKDIWEVSQEPPDASDPKTHDRIGTAQAPLFSTFAAHFAEASERFWPYFNIEGSENQEDHVMLDDYLIRIPITNGAQVWYGIET